MAKYTISADQCLGKAAARPIHSGMPGIEASTSITFWMSRSAIPPNRPETAPITSPSSRLMQMLTRPMEHEILVAIRVREKMSRPRWSVPNSATTPGCSTPNRWTRVGNSPSRRYSWPRSSSRTG